MVEVNGLGFEVGVVVLTLVEMAGGVYTGILDPVQDYMHDFDTRYTNSYFLMNVCYA